MKIHKIRSVKEEKTHQILDVMRNMEMRILSSLVYNSLHEIMAFSTIIDLLDVSE